MARPRSRTPELRHRILTSAIDLVDNQGLSALTTRNVAAAADTNVAALDELFGGKSGLIDAVAHQAFEQLSMRLDATRRGGDAVGDAVLLAAEFRSFASARPHLFELVFSRPFDTFSPTEVTLEAADNIRHHFVGRVAACLAINPSEPAAKDAAIGLVALVQGLSLQERANTLGSTAASADRRWHSAVSAFLHGLVDRAGR